MEDEIYICCTEKNLQAYFTKEKCFKIFLISKALDAEERCASIDLRGFQRSNLIETIAAIEKVEQNQFAENLDEAEEVESESDEEFPFEDEKELLSPIKQQIPTVRVDLEYEKIGMATEYEDESKLLLFRKLTNL